MAEHGWAERFIYGFHAKTDAWREVNDEQKQRLIAMHVDRLISALQRQSEGIQSGLYAAGCMIAIGLALVAGAILFVGL